MSSETFANEIKKRIPRIITNGVILFFLFIILNVAPLFIPDLSVPGINIGVIDILRMLITLMLLVFLARIASDAIILADIATNIVIVALGIKSQQPLTRLGRDIVYILLDIFLSAAVIPFFSNIPTIGDSLVVIASIIFLAIFIIFLYDVGRIIHRTLEEKADMITEWIVEKASQTRKTD